jgi:hypothetical protein
MHLTEQIAGQKRTDPIAARSLTGVAVNKSPLFSDLKLGVGAGRWCIVWKPIFTQRPGTSESVPNRRALASQAPPLIAPQACPQKSRDHRGTRSDHPEFAPICERPLFQIKQHAPFVREHQLHPADVAPIHSASQHSTPRPSFGTAQPTRCISCPPKFSETQPWKYYIHVPFVMCKIILQLP